MARLADKVALITGASSGIGEATARRFAAEGAKIVVGGLTDEDAEPIARGIRDAGGQAIGVGADLSDEVAIKDLVARTIAAYGRIDVLHNNAALTSPDFLSRDRDLLNLETEVWDRSMTVNLRGPMLLSRYALPHMIEKGGGSIIFTGSGKGVQGDLGGTAYGVTKAGLILLSKNIATQYGKERIRSNVIVVGLVASRTMRESMPPALCEMMEQHHLTPYLGETEHIANVALFLASDESAFVTGHELYADGGVTSHTPMMLDLRKRRQP